MGRRVPVADAFLQPDGSLLKDPVAGEMAHGVVDVLEVVEVDEKDGDQMAAAVGAPDGGLEPFAEFVAVGKLGQGVGPARAPTGTRGSGDEFAVGVALNSPLKKALLTGFHSTAKHNATKAVSPSSETMRTI